MSSGSQNIVLPENYVDFRTQELEYCGGMSTLAWVAVGVCVCLAIGGIAMEIRGLMGSYVQSECLQSEQIKLGYRHKQLKYAILDARTISRQQMILRNGGVALTSIGVCGGVQSGICGQEGII